MSLHDMKSKYLTKPFVVKTAGGAASQCLGLMSAIYISSIIKRPFVIKHYPFSTGGYFPLAIAPLLSKDEIVAVEGMTRGLNIRGPLVVGKIIEEHPLLKKGVTYEKLLSYIRRLHLETLAKRMRSEWSINYSKRRLEKTPVNIKFITGGYFPFVNVNVNNEMDSRFKRAGLPSPYSSEARYEPKPFVVIHYRIGDKRTTYSHQGIQGDGIVDPISFKEILQHEKALGREGIYVISDEPKAAQALLLSVGIHANVNPVRGNLWNDLNLMAQAELIICPWSTVSQFALSFLIKEGRTIYYPDSTSEGYFPKWKLEGYHPYRATFLSKEHPIYRADYMPPVGAHQIYPESKVSK
jgi:hypothetical protein